MLISILILIPLISITYFSLVLRTRFSPEQLNDMGIYIEDLQTPSTDYRILKQERVLLKVAACCNP